MSMALIIAIGVILLIVVIGAVQRSGPRVTQITRTREKKDDDA